MTGRQKLYGGVRLLGDGPCLDNVRRIDANAMPMIIEMAQNGLQVDLAHFAKLDIELTKDMDRITEDVHDLTGYYINVSSPDQKSDLLFKKLGLKQARPKMTKSGDRESVEDEVLTAIQHDHPVVPKLLEYAELDKLRGTYVRPMPKLARHVAFNEWRMFPNFNTTRVPSGRLSCKEPNLLAMPTRTERGRDIRKGFIAKDGWVYVSVDECLHPDTKVTTILGDKRIADILPGEKVLTLRGDRIKWGAVTKSSQIQPKMAYRITLDNGESVIASATHKWPVQMTPPGSLSVIQDIQTDHLRVWDRMVPCRTGLSSAGYPVWYAHRGSFKYSFKHHIVAEAMLGRRPAGSHVHHKDEDKSNFKPSNLEYVDGAMHSSRHSKANYSKQDHTKRITALQIALKSRRKYFGTDNPNCKLSELDTQGVLRLIEVGCSASDISEVFDISYGYARRLMKKLAGNHKITSIEKIGIQPMWAITVEPDHNYVLACGIVTCNSQIEVRIAAHCSEDPALCSVYINEEDVYCDFATAAFKLKDERHRSDSGKWEYPGVDPRDHRRPSKTCVLASIYDVTAGGLLEQMPIICGGCNLEATKHTCGRFRAHWTENKCQDLINAFYIKYPGLIRDRRKYHSIMRSKALIYDIWGRLLHVTAVRSVLEWVVSGALREGANFPYQSGAQGTIKLTMAQVFDDLEAGDLLPLMRPLLQVHDELLFECREQDAEELGEHVKSRFESCVELKVPIKANWVSAPTWGDLEK